MPLLKKEVFELVAVAEDLDTNVFAGSVHSKDVDRVSIGQNLDLVSMAS